MDELSIQSQMADSQKLIFEILDVVYESEHPISLETITDRVQEVSPDKLLDVLTDLVSAGSLQVHICNGCANYHKPQHRGGPFPPLVFFID